MSDSGKRMVSSHRVVSVSMVALIAVVLVAVGAITSAVLLPEPQPSSVASTALTGMVAVSGQKYDGSHTVGVSAQVGEAQMLRSAAAGIVTDSECTSGGMVESGVASWSVNGQPLVGLATTTPLWRDLTPGVQGADVVGLQNELSRLGYGVSVTGTVDAATRNAVRELMASVGSSSAEGSLPLSWVVWLPAAEVGIASCTVNAGDPITPGGELAQLEGGLQALVMANPPGEGWVATYQGHTAVVDTDGRITDPRFLGAVEAGPEYRYYASTGQGSLSIQVALAEPRQVVAVPPSSVVVTSPGAGCLVTGTGVVGVTIVSSSLGQTLVAVKGGSQPDAVVVQPDSGTVCP